MLPSIVIALLIASIIAAERQHAKAEPRADALLYMVADSERELTRLPAKFTRLSDQQENASGNDIAGAILKDRGELHRDNAVVEQYVQRVGAALATHARRKLRYQFHYLPEREFVNAFAIPGGHVFMGAGLVEQLTTEDQIAAVIAHEIEHVDHYHCAERLQVEAALRKIPLGAVLEIPTEVFHAGYSKDEEAEADREGLRLATAAGYSANGALHAFEALERLAHEHEKPARTPQAEAGRVAADVLTGYFRSHPPTADRIAMVRAAINSEPALATRPERPSSVRYIFLALQSFDALDKDAFADAAGLAGSALALKPDHIGALIALAEASYGLERFGTASDAYRKVLAHDASDADAIAKWAEARASKLSQQSHYDRAIALTRSILELQPGKPELLRVLGLAQANGEDLDGAKATAATMRTLYADAALKLAAEAQDQAATLLGAHKFARAATMASFGLALQPGSAALLKVLGASEFSRGRFAESADAYRAMFDEKSVDSEWLRSFADALGTAHPSTASRELQTLVAGKTLNSVPDMAVQTEIAGLSILAKDDAAALKIRDDVREGTTAPEVLGRLGWWYFRANRLADADAFLSEAQKARPGDPDIQNARAWVALERGANVITPGSAVAETALQNMPDVREALAEWQGDRRKDALRDWDAVAHTRPQWLNAEWRAALYPARINAIAQQMEAERLQRAAVITAPSRRLPR